jgi:hypothetical protein
LPLDVLRVVLSTERTNVYIKNADRHRSRGRKEPSRHPKSSLHRAHSSQYFELLSIPGICSSPASPSFFAPPIVYIIVDLSLYSAERCGGISRRSRRGRRKGSQRVSGCPSVRISPLAHATNLPYSLPPLSPFLKQTPSPFYDVFVLVGSTAIWTAT